MGTLTGFVHEAEEDADEEGSFDKDEQDGQDDVTGKEEKKEEEEGEDGEQEKRFDTDDADGADLGKRTVWGRTVWAERTRPEGMKWKDNRGLWPYRLRVPNFFATCAEAQRTQHTTSLEQQPTKASSHVLCESVEICG